MEIKVLGQEITFDEEVIQQKWKIVLDCMDFYNDDVKKFASLYSEIYSLKLSKNAVDMKNLLAINLLVLSKVDLEDGMKIEYDDDKTNSSDYIIPIILDKNDIDIEDSNGFMNNITDVISDLINDRLLIGGKNTILYINTPINNIETNDNGDTLKIDVYCCFGTN